ncbi:unnamed protein product [Calicophoron daubneyi]
MHSGGCLQLNEIPPWNQSVEGRPKNGESPPPIGMRISLWSGDITRLKIDAIANAANSRLAGGGGVDGAIHRAAGRELYSACAALGGCPTGSAKITPGFKLPAKHIIHCVGPVGENPTALRSTYKKALELCSQNDLKSIAFPCISTGVYGYPSHPAAEVAIQTVLSYLRDHTEIERVIFCVFLTSDYNIYKDLIPKILPKFAN